MIIRVGKYDKEYYINPIQMLVFFGFMFLTFILGLFIIKSYNLFPVSYLEPVNCSNVSDILLVQDNLNYCIYKKYVNDSNLYVTNISF